MISIAFTLPHNAKQLSDFANPVFQAKKNRFPQLAHAYLRLCCGRTVQQKVNRRHLSCRTTSSLEPDFQDRSCQTGQWKLDHFGRNSGLFDTCPSAAMHNACISANVALLDLAPTPSICGFKHTSSHLWQRMRHLLIMSRMHILNSSASRSCSRELCLMYVGLYSKTQSGDFPPPALRVEPREP